MARHELNHRYRGDIVPVGTGLWSIAIGPEDHVGTRSDVECIMDDLNHAWGQACREEAERGRVQLEREARERAS